VRSHAGAPQLESSVRGRPLPRTAWPHALSRRVRRGACPPEPRGLARGWLVPVRAPVVPLLFRRECVANREEINEYGRERVVVCDLRGHKQARAVRGPSLRGCVARKQRAGLAAGEAHARRLPARRSRRRGAGCPSTRVASRAACVPGQGGVRCRVRTPRSARRRRHAELMRDTCACAARAACRLGRPSQPRGGDARARNLLPPASRRTRRLTHARSAPRAAAAPVCLACLHARSPDASARPAWLAARTDHARAFHDAPEAARKVAFASRSPGARALRRSRTRGRGPMPCCAALA
jgi:hypothetical protein